MFRISVCVCAFFLLACCAVPMAAQQPAAASADVAVPPMVNFSGVLTDVIGKPLTGAVGVTFSLYKESQGGIPLWMETQNVQADKTGHYSAALGSTSSQGLPAALFASGEARWLSVQAQGGAEQPRVLLMSVPYAMKALDAETIGGKPVSSFMLALPSSGSSGKGPTAPPGTITGAGTAGFIPVFTGPTTIANSKIFQTVGTNLGIGTTTPSAKLDVKGSGAFRDTLTLFPKLSHPTLSVKGTAFAVSNTGKVTFVAGQTFPGTGTLTSVGSGAGLTGGPITTTGTISIKTSGVTNAMLAHSSLTITANSPLTGGGSVSLGSTTSLGLTSSCSSGQILKWNGASWACAADNNSGGTVTSVGSGLGLTGGPITGSGTLAIDTAVVPRLGTNNTFTANQTIAGNGLNVVLGNVGCNPPTWGIVSSTRTPPCSNFILGFDDSQPGTYINRPTGGTIHFREGNGSDQMTIFPASSGIGVNIAGTVGIGEGAATNYRLRVRGISTSNGTVPFLVEDGNGNALFYITDGGEVVMSFLQVASTATVCSVIFASQRGFTECSSAAEYVPNVDDGFGFADRGDLVSVAHTAKNPYADIHAPFAAVKTSHSCDDGLLGFITDPKSGASGKKLNEHYLPLAIYGYFPAKVTMQNGPIRRGDPITSSSKPGYGMKATGACKIIGYALEDTRKEGRIQVFAHLSENAAPKVAGLQARVTKLQRENVALRRQLQDVVSQVREIRAELNRNSLTAELQQSQSDTSKPQN
jgi:hypothetical protein